MGRKCEDIGREDLLVRHLEMAKAREARASAISLMKKVNLSKTAQSMLMTVYDGREDVLLLHLSRLESLAEGAGVNRSAEELLAAFEGKEDVLFGHLERLGAIRAKASDGD